MRPHSYAQRLRLLAGVAMFSALAPVAVAGDNGRAVPLLPQYKQECDSCHIAYSPTLMPAASWKRLLGNLPEHFGTDASLDPATLNRISAWVNAHAGTDKRVSEEPHQDRITRTAWFAQEHREVSSASWRLPAVKSAANCGACHTQADQGDFNERNIRPPR